MSVTFDEGSATLNGEEYSSGTIITTPGEYRLVIIDDAGNETITTFVIEKTMDTMIFVFGGVGLVIIIGIGVTIGILRKKK